MNLEINNININNRRLAFNIFDNETYIVYSKDEKLCTDLLLFLAGINGNLKKTDGKVLYNKKNVFDNEDYFKIRIYMDFKEKYLSTLTPSVIKDSVKHKYDLDVDTNIFKKEITKLNARKETKITNEYIFTKQANTFVNYAFLKSLNIKNVIIDNMLLNIESEEKINYIIDEILDKERYNTVIIGTSRIEYFLNRSVKFIMFSENEGHLINPKTDKLLIVEDNIYLRNRLFNLDNGFVVCFNDYKKEELKNLSSRKIKYKEMGLNDIFKHIKRGKYEVE